MKKFATRAALAASLVAGSAMAVTPYDAVTAAVNWTDVGTGIGAVALALAGVFVLVRGFRILLGMIRGR